MGQEISKARETWGGGTPEDPGPQDRGYRGILVRKEGDSGAGNSKFAQEG